MNGFAGTVARGVRHAGERLAHPFRLRAALRRLSRRPTPRVVLVVCHGNLYRSPYAAARLRQRFAAPSGSGVRVTSAGFIGPGRSCPEVAVAVAAGRGLDLSGHRSELLTPAVVQAADFIVVMDTAQRWGIRALFGRHPDDIVLLGDLDPEPIQTRGIQDPLDLQKETFERVYGRIDRCVGALVRTLSASAEPVRGDSTGRRERSA